MGRHAELAQATLHTEMDLHRSYAAEFGITPEELEREVKAPTCQAYTDFLIRTAALGSYAELMGALLPCMWGFSEIGHRLAEQGMPEEERYAKWVRMYTDPEFAVLVDWCRQATDAAAQGLPRAEQERGGDGVPHQQPLRVPLLGDGLAAGDVAGVEGFAPCPEEYKRGYRPAKGRHSSPRRDEGTSLWLGSS